MITKSEEETSQIELFDDQESGKSPSPWLPTDGRDELNLAEFPLAALSNRIAPGQKTLVFRDSVYDNQARERVQRQLTITAADKYGLPNAVDDEIILALIQLSKRQEFASKTVPFSRYEIIQILGWDDQTWNYRRIMQALERWTSVTLKYENAWWNHAAKAWVDETFHIIERLTEIKDTHGKERAAFVWSDVIFQNLQSGNLKTLDLQLYRRLTIPTAKRLYRLLDKRFYRHRRVEFDLVELAFHKLGVSQNYLIGNIKQRIQPAIEELEAVGFIKPMAKEKRYRKHAVGEWNVIFERADAAGAEPSETLLVTPDQPLSEVEAHLIELGVSALKARRLATTHPEGFLREKIDVVRYLKARSAAEIKNPAGYLVKSIEEKYALPDGYQNSEQRAAEQKLREEQSAKRQKVQKDRQEGERAKAEQEAQQAAERTQKVAAYLAGLTPRKREQITAAAMAQQIAAGHGWFMGHKGKTGEVARKLAVEEYILSLLPEQGTKAPK